MVKAGVGIIIIICYSLFWLLWYLICYKKIWRIKLYRITRCHIRHDNGQEEKDYVYVLGDRQLGEWVYESVYYDYEIIWIDRLVINRKTFKKCFGQTVTLKNQNEYIHLK